MSVPLPQDALPTGHELTFVDGRFASAACSCGWRSAGRRDRRIARQEASDHLTLYVGTAEAIEIAVPAPAQEPQLTTDA